MDPRVVLLVLCLCGSGLLAAEIRNQSEPLSLRLVGGTSRCAGELELKLGGERKPVAQLTTRNVKWNSVCTELGCGSAVSGKQTRHPSVRPTWDLDISCDQVSSSLSDCEAEYEHSTSSVGREVICSDSVRLSGTNRCSGRLEVKTNQSWSSVCGGAFDLQDAEVACRELGCGAPSGLQGAPSPSGLQGAPSPSEAPLWSREFLCKGDESRLLDCGRSDSAPNTCSPDGAVGLTCSDPVGVRLVGETSRCAGEVELKNKGEWRATYVEKGTMMFAAAVCEELGCGSAVSGTGKRQSNRLVSVIHTDCVQASSSLSGCLDVEENSYSTLGTEVICSGLLTQPNVSVSTSFDGWFEGWELLVFWGFSFTIGCSAEPQYPGGSFRLLVSTRDTERSYTLPAVNHSARFLFPSAAYGHQGNYTCVYHAHVFSYNFSSESQPLHVTVSGFIRDQIIRHVVVLTTFALCNTCIYLYFKNKARRMMKEEEEEEVEEEEEEAGRRRRRRILHV